MKILYEKDLAKQYYRTFIYKHLTTLAVCYGVNLWQRYCNGGTGQTLSLEHCTYWWYIIEEEDHAIPRPHLRLKYAVAIRDGFFRLFRDQALGV